MRARSVGGLLLCAAGLAAAWALVAPRELGGPVSYVVIYGNSMEPGLIAGDLVSVREASSYGVGDAVAYYNPDIRELVLHRIISIENGRYRFQGDNNDFVDPYRPRRNELVGKMWFRVGGAGTVLKRLQAPMPAAILAGVVGLIMAGGIGAAEKHRRAATPQEGTGRPPPARRGSGRPPSTRKVVTGLFAVGVLLFGALLVRALGTPDVETRTTRIPYTHTATWTYEADAPKGPVYESDVGTGDPIFLKVVETVDVTMDYEFETEEAAQLETDGSLTARLTAPNGWTRTFPLVEEQELPSSGRLNGTLDLASVSSAIDRVESATGVVQHVYQLDLLGAVHGIGAVGSATFDETFESRLRFNVDTQQMQLSRGTEEPVVPSEEPITTSEGGRIEVASSVPARVEAGPLSLPVESARWAGIAGLGLCAIGLLIVGASWLRAIRRDEATRIQAKYGSSLISARTPNLTKARVSVEVESIEALARLAERFDVPILHHDSGYEHRYVVDGGSTVYVYATSSDRSREDAGWAGAEETKPLTDERDSHEPVG